MMDFLPPEENCRLCARLCAFRAQNRRKFPSYHNAPVDPFGSLSAQILIVGLAPGLNGANQTNRPFTNDYAGDVLYPILKKYGFAEGDYQKRKDDGFTLANVRVTNAVRCVPPQNKPLGEEEKNCRRFLAAEIAAMPNLKIILSLGTVSHKNVLQALGLKASSVKFAHGALHRLPPVAEHPDGLILADSYHTSRYNINTGVLTFAMFEEIISNIKGLLNK